MTTPLHNGRPVHERPVIDMLPAPSDCFVFRAKLVRVIDGDTLDLVIDQGMHCERTERVRLLGVNCPETRGETRNAGRDATDWVKWWCACRPEAKWPLMIKTEKGDAFGRWLAHVWCAETGRYLNGELVNEGHAVPYGEK